MYFCGGSSPVAVNATRSTVFSIVASTNGRNGTLLETNRVREVPRRLWRM